MLEIECLVCGQAIEIPQFIDTDNYDGQIRCPACKSLLRMRLVRAKLRKYEVTESGTTSIEGNAGQRTGGEKADVESIARYNPLRDYLVSYHANQLNLSFEYIEHIIDSNLETAAYTFKSWWENDRKRPQAISWLEAGWEVDNVDLQRQVVVFRRVKAR
jgi:DNA-directed RNA polymerase subunit RPC12/RpoP